jgi:hypothetical protein
MLAQLFVLSVLLVNENYISLMLVVNCHLYLLSLIFFSVYIRYI